MPRRPTTRTEQEPVTVIGAISAQYSNEESFSYTTIPNLAVATDMNLSAEVKRHRSAGRGWMTQFRGPVRVTVRPHRNLQIT